MYVRITSILIFTLIVFACKNEKATLRQTSLCDELYSSPVQQDAYFFPFKDSVDAGGLECDYLNKDNFSDGFKKLVRGFTGEYDQSVPESIASILMPSIHVSNDTTHTNRVNRILDRLQVHTTDDSRYNIYVIDVSWVNASAFPGNNILVTSALLNTFEEDDVVAFCIAHEIGHHRCNHFEKEYQMYHYLFNRPDKKALVDNLKRLGLFYFDKATERLQTFWDQSQELEADAVGVYLTAAGGYDPSAGKRFFEKMKDLDVETNSFWGRAKGSYYRTHPFSEDRVSCIKTCINKYKCNISKYRPLSKIIEGRALKPLELKKFPHEMSKNILNIEKDDIFCIFGTITNEFVKNDSHHTWLYCSVNGYNGWVMEEYVKY